MLFSKVKSAVIGFPMIVIKLNEYQDSLNDTIIKKNKNGMASLDSL